MSVLEIVGLVTMSAVAVAFLLFLGFVGLCIKDLLAKEDSDA